LAGRLLVAVLLKELGNGVSARKLLVESMHPSFVRTKKGADANSVDAAFSSIRHRPKNPDISDNISFQASDSVR
jgi:hypothetical protein